MSFENKIKLNTHYTRSINIERDANSIEVIKSYIPTSRAVRTLNRMSDSFGVKSAPRAWSLIGPYGSGKSSFSIFLNHLVSDPEELATKTAYKVLNVEKSLAYRFKKETKGTKGHFKILVSGAPESLSKRLMVSFAEAAKSYWSNLPGANPAIVKTLSKRSNQEKIDPSVILQSIKDLQLALKGKSSGILLVIDELGKFLEYEARHYGANDIFLLQQLAELACEGNEINLYLFVLLHQSFEQYAKGLGETLKKEWAKIQGRFEDIPFLEGTEQTLRVVGNAFKQTLDKSEKTELAKQVTKSVNVLSKEGALPGVLTEKEASSLFENCYPLHPVTSLILPLLCQKVAQNERTLFSFLGSKEPYGLKNLLDSFVSVKQFVMPYHIFDYFITNQPAALGDHITHRRWAEVMTALERVGDISRKSINLLKTIGLFNIIGAHAGLKASRSLLENLFGTKKVVTPLIQQLEERSVVQYRKFNAEYRVWQGSDFDVELAVQDELSNLGQFSLSSVLNRRANFLPIVARRYTIQNGTLRYFVPLFVDAQSYTSISRKDKYPRIIFYLATGKDDEVIFHKTVKNHFGELDVVGLCLNALSLREAVAEVEALDKVRTGRQELNSDPVAMREYIDRLGAAERTEQLLLRELIDTPESITWFYDSEKLDINNKRQFQEKLSLTLKAVFHSAPIIHNELINRDKPSSQAVAARGKLLQLMLNSSHLENLGIEKNPPEKAIYNSLIKLTGIHQCNEKGEWHIAEPALDARKHRKTEFHKVWKEIKSFVESTEDSPKSFGELDRLLVAPPYGVKAGLLPILYASTYLIYQSDLALYENRRYIPRMEVEHLERFIKRPDEFAVQYFKIEGLKESIFAQYNEALFGIKGSQKKSGKKRKLLELAKPLAEFMGDLPDYTQKTKRLSKEAAGLRSAFQLSKSPVKLIFEDIPKALGFNAVDEEAEEVKGLAEKLTVTLRELKYAHSELIRREFKLLSEAFGLNKELKLSELRQDIAGKVAGLDSFTVDVSGVRAFLQRLTKKTNDDENWLKNVLMFLGHKPTDKWSDSDQDQAEYRLNQFSRQILDLHKLWIQYESHSKETDEDFDVILLRSIKKGHGEIDSVVTIDKGSAEVIKSTKSKIFKYLQELGDSELRLAALAEVVNEFLEDYKQSDSSVSERKEQDSKKEA